MAWNLRGGLANLWQITNHYSNVTLASWHLKPQKTRLFVEQSARAGEKCTLSIMKGIHRLLMDSSPRASNAECVFISWPHCVFLWVYFLVFVLLPTTYSYNVLPPSSTGYSVLHKQHSALDYEIVFHIQNTTVWTSFMSFFNAIFNQLLICNSDSRNSPWKWNASHPVHYKIPTPQQRLYM